MDERITKLELSAVLTNFRGFKGAVCGLLTSRNHYHINCEELVEFNRNKQDHWRGDNQPLHCILHYMALGWILQEICCIASLEKTWIRSCSSRAHRAKAFTVSDNGRWRKEGKTNVEIASNVFILYTKSWEKKQETNKRQDTNLTVKHCCWQRCLGVCLHTCALTASISLCSLLIIRLTSATSPFTMRSSSPNWLACTDIWSNYTQRGKCPYYVHHCLVPLGTELHTLTEKKETLLS